MNDKETIKRILRCNFIRRIDGRYKDVFVSLDALEAMIQSGEAHVFQGADSVEFVSRPPRKTVTLPLELVQEIHDMLTTCGYGGRNARRENKHARALLKAIEVTR
jgi:hypothetical protein